jgi:glutamate-1-semialdehyde aminotransferase
MTKTKNAALLDRAYRVRPGGALVSYYMPESVEFVVERGEGPSVWDVDGKRYVSLVHDDAGLDSTLEVLDAAIMAVC